MADFAMISVSNKGNENAVRNSIEKLSKLTLTIKKKDVETSVKLLNYYDLPGTKAYYITLSPLVLNLFSLSTTTLNMLVLNNIKSSDTKVSMGLTPQLYGMSMTYNRKKMHNVSMDEIMLRSPHNLMKLQSEDKIDGEIISVEHGKTVGKVKGMTFDVIRSQMLRQRKQVVEFYESFSKLRGFTSQISGKGQGINFSFKIDTKLEKIASDVVSERLLVMEMEKPTKKLV